MNKETNYRYGVIFIGSRDDLRELQSQLEMITPKNTQILKELLSRNMMDIRELNQPLED